MNLASLIVMRSGTISASNKADVFRPINIDGDCKEILCSSEDTLTFFNVTSNILEFQPCQRNMGSSISNS